MTPRSGAMDVSYPDPMQPEYSQHLKTATAVLNVVDTPTNTPTVCVPANNSLDLTVSFHLPPPPPSQLPLQLESPDLKQCAGVTNKSDRVSPTVQWLVEAAQSQDGYTAFKQGQHHVQMNADIMASW